MQINKSDRNDAAGLARIMQCWLVQGSSGQRTARVTRSEATLNSRAQLIKIKGDLGEPNSRLAQKSRSYHVGKARRQRFPQPGAKILLSKNDRFCQMLSCPLLEVRETVRSRDCRSLQARLLACGTRTTGIARRSHDRARASGRSPLWHSTPRLTTRSRFRRSRSVGAYFGLTSRRYPSGEIDWTGRISKCGDGQW